MPGSVPISEQAVLSELTQYLPDAWKPIIDADIDGEGSTPLRIDSGRSTFGSRALTRRIARTIFVGSAPTLRTAHKGIERQHVWLGVAVPGDTVGNFGSALEVLSQRATYLCVDGARYWYDTQASVTRTAQDFADRLREHPEVVWAVLVPDQPDPARPLAWQVLKAESSQERLADRVTVKLRQEGLLATVYGARNVRMDLDGPLGSVWSRGHVPVGDLWSFYCRYPYLTRLRDRTVLDAAVRSVLDEIGWEVEGFALADGFDETSGRYQGLAIPHEGSYGQVTDVTLLVLPAIARRQQEADQAAAAAEAGSIGIDETEVAQGPGGTVWSGSRASSERPPDVQPGPENVRFFGAMQLNPERYGRDLTRVARELLQHLAAVDGTQLQVRVEITEVKADGFPPDTVRIVTENARTLKFEPFGFEND